MFKDNELLDTFYKALKTSFRKFETVLVLEIPNEYLEIPEEDRLNVSFYMGQADAYFPALKHERNLTLVR